MADAKNKNKNPVDPEMLNNLELLMDLEVLEAADEWETWEQVDSDEEEEQ